MEQQYILLVEGPDDEHVIKHLCKSRNHSFFNKVDENEVQIKQKGGVQNLLNTLSIELTGSGLKVLGVIVDADMSLESRWQQVREQLRKAGYSNIPSAPNPKGTVLPSVEGSLLPRFGVWIMPDNQTSGILEDFLRWLVPQDSQLFPHVQSSIDSIPETERHFSENDKPKAVIHTWLAWQKEPGKPLGVSITAKYLDPDVEQVGLLLTWLMRLFENQSDDNNVSIHSDLPTS